MYVAKATRKKIKLQAMTVSCMCINYHVKKFRREVISLYIHQNEHDYF